MLVKVPNYATANQRGSRETNSFKGKRIIVVDIKKRRERVTMVPKKKKKGEGIAG